MDEEAKRFDVGAAWCSSLSVWARHIIVFTALSAVSFFFLQMLRGTLKVTAWLWPQSALATACVAGALVLAWVAAHGFVTLLIVNHFRDFLRGSRPVFSESFAEARKSWGRYVLSVLVLMGFGLFVLFLAVGLLEAGTQLYAADHSNIAGLIGTHLVAVIFIIALGWYGFYFSLAPLVGAYETRWPIAAFRESRRRIRGRATGYVLALLLFVLGYLAVGLAAYYGVAGLGGVVSDPTAKWVLGRAQALVDPAMLTLFSPLWCALWYVSYVQLTRLKAAAG